MTLTRMQKLSTTSSPALGKGRAVYHAGWVCAALFVAALACSDPDKKSTLQGGVGGSAGEAGGSGVTTGSGGTSSGGTSSGGNGTSVGGADGSVATAANTGNVATGTSAVTSTGDTGGAGTSGAGGAGMGIDAFCELLQARARSWLRECRNFGDAADFWGTQRIDRFCSSGRAAVEAGRLVYDPLQAEACAALSVGGCEDIEAFAYSVEAIPQAGWLQSDVCEGVVTGLVPLGGACHAASTDYAHECSEGFCTTATCPGTCTTYASVGEACDIEPGACEPSAGFCNSAGMCQAYLPLGGVCDDAQCAPGDLCRFDANQGSSVCVPAVELGDACEPTLLQCVQNLECHMGVCSDEVPLGAECIDTAHCPAGAYCDGTCLTRVPLDGDCAQGQTCVDGATCDGATCVTPGDEGEPCPCTLGLYCDAENTCQVPGGVGEDCTVAGVGAQNLCESSLRCVPAEIVNGVPASFTCQVQGGENDPCLPQTANTCKAPFFCHPTSFSCVPPAGLGETCNFALPRDSCQPGQYCACTQGCDGPPQQAIAECAAKLPNGSDCTLSRACASDFCNSTCQESPLCY